MANGDYSAWFGGEAALGAWRDGRGFKVYAVDGFGFREPGRFSASFRVYRVAAPVGPDDLADRIYGECEAYYDGCDNATLLEACERYDCAPSGLGRAMGDELISEAGGDPYAAYRELRDGDVLAFSEGAPRIELASGGQADEFGRLDHLLADASLVAEVARLWGANNLSDMHPGTPRQERALEEAGLKGADYPLRVAYLEEVGLIEDDWQDVTGHRYGSGWLDRGVSVADACATAEAVEALKALPGPEEAALAYIGAHPDCFGGGR